MHKCHMVIDLQFGSTGKGLLAGYLAKREDYDTAVCSFATNAGHTYIDQERGIHVMTQQLPTAITSPTVRNVLLGPGALIHVKTLQAEMVKYQDLLHGKRILIHPQAAIVTGSHAEEEMLGSMSRIGSTTKGVGAAAIQRIRRQPGFTNIADAAPHREELEELGCVIDAQAYRDCLEHAESVIVEGAQGFSLSMYHGFYPYTTSRDVTPWQIAADCGLPYKWASYIQVKGTLRTFPIRVNNRDGYSGPMYPDQEEITFESLGLEPELTTVTKLPRRLFTFSDEQLEQALWHCGGYWETELFLNFVNYMPDLDSIDELIKRIETPSIQVPNRAKVRWLGTGPDDTDVTTRAEWEGGLE